MDLEEEIILTMLIIMNEKKRMNLRRRHYLTRAALTEPNQSAWREIKNSKDDMAFLDTTGMTYAVFLKLRKAFKKCWDGPIWQSRERKITSSLMSKSCSTCRLELDALPFCHGIKKNPVRNK